MVEPIIWSQTPNTGWSPRGLFGTVHEISVLITCPKMPLINMHTDVSRNDTGLIFSQSLHLHPYFVYASSEGSGVSVHIYSPMRGSRIFFRWGPNLITFFFSFFFSN